MRYKHLSNTRYVCMVGMAGWEEVEREVARYAVYRRLTGRRRRRRRRDPMKELGLTDGERTVAYLIALGLCGAVMAISAGLVYMVAIILSAIYRSEFWDALLTATGLFMLFLWPIPFLILIFILDPILDRAVKRRAGSGSGSEEPSG